MKIILYSLQYTKALIILVFTILITSYVIIMSTVMQVSFFASPITAIGIFILLAFFYISVFRLQHVKSKLIINGQQLQVYGTKINCSEIKMLKYTYLNNRVIYLTIATFNDTFTFVLTTAFQKKKVELLLNHKNYIFTEENYYD